MRSRRVIAVPAAVIIAAMALAIVAFGAIAYWEERREVMASREDFAREQTTLARAAAAGLEAWFSEVASAPARPVDALRKVVGPIEEPGTLLAFVLLGDRSGLLGTAGVTVHSARVEAAFDQGGCLSSREKAPCWLRLSHEESAALGLPPRSSVAALSGFLERDGVHRGVVIAATASRHSDREERALWRLALSFLISSGLVLGLGSLALRTQRKDLELARELAVAEAVRERDERLGRADKLATLGALAMGVAHQVSTPLGVIVGRVEQLTPKVAGDERALRAVTAIGQQAERISGIVRAFLGLARGGTPSIEHVAPASLARAAVDLVEHRFAQSGVSIAQSVAEDLPQVACDPQLIEQAIVNLLLNACDACEGGGNVELAVRIEGERVTFQVTDDGVGIAPEAVLHATEPFFTTKPRGRGTGLGLAIASEIVAHHQGELTIAPRTDGPGTRACIALSKLEEKRHG
jgi:two-component system NtrC family sensor kinase